MVVFCATIVHYHISNKNTVCFFTSSQAVSFCTPILHGATDKNTNLRNTCFVKNPASGCTKPFYSEFTPLKLPLVQNEDGKILSVSSL